MANRTARDAHTVKGTNPQYLVEKIIRTRIYDSIYWKEQCFGLSAETVVDRGMELRFIGGVYGGNIKPAPYLCLILKLLQLQPEKDIVIEFIRQDDFKYIRALGAMYIRLTFSSVEVYKYLEPLYNDYRKLRLMNRMGTFELIHMDEYIDTLLREDHYCDIQLPRLQKRQALEETDQLEMYQSALDEDLEQLSTSSDSEDERERRRTKPSIVSRRRSRSRTRSRSRERNRRMRSPPPAESRRTGASSSSKGGGGGGSSRADQEREIEESNALRKKLGMAPLER